MPTAVDERDGLVHEHLLAPDPADQQELAELNEQITRFSDFMQSTRRRPRHGARLVGPDGTEVEIPASAFTALKAVVRDMANGRTITLIPHERELTTKEAADILQVSRQHLVKVLDRGDIPFHRVGTHRRIRVEDVLAYREQRAHNRRSRLRELTQASQEVESGYS